MTKKEEIAKAKKRRAKVLAMREKGWTLAKIAQREGGVSTACISALLKKAKADLRSPA